MKNAFRPCGHAPPQSVTQLHGVCIFCYRDRLGTETARLREHAVILAAAVEEGSLLLQQALDALEYHREQTRPIQRTEDAIAALRVRLGPNSAKAEWDIYSRGGAGSYQSSS